MIQDEQHFPVESESLGPLEDRKYMTRVGISHKILVHFFQSTNARNRKKNRVFKRKSRDRPKFGRTWPGALKWPGAVGFGSVHDQNVPACTWNML